MGVVTMDMLLSQDYRSTGVSLPCTPNSLYAQARQRARRGQIWSSLTGRTQVLLSLKQVRAACAVESESDGGVRTVPISQIRGSEGRSRYFDRDFNPLYDQARGRWLGIARARQQGKALPPVSLVQVGDAYFVQDGHHRISVARALGQTDLEARVTVWQVTVPVSWEEFEEPTYLRRAVDKLRSKSGRLWARLAQSVQALRVKETAAQSC
jgi:hypothetical protein